MFKAETGSPPPAVAQAIAAVFTVFPCLVVAGDVPFPRVAEPTSVTAREVPTRLPRAFAVRVLWWQMEMSHKEFRGKVGRDAAGRSMSFWSKKQKQQEPRKERQTWPGWRKASPCPPAVGEEHIGELKVPGSTPDTRLGANEQP